MKVFVVYGFWLYDNGAAILEVFDSLDKAKEYVDNFDYTFKISKYHEEFNYLEIEEKEVK